ncbi:MAG: TfoX/Sxy family protein [Alloprevotella sp.]|nr:TfoX/Sxy family protein [Alloprevotella sp.]
MACNADLVQYLVEQCGPEGQVEARKMFGDYGLYLDDILVGLICDNNLYLKPTEAGRALMPSVQMRPPYDGAKDYFYISEVDHRDFLTLLVRTTAQALSKPLRDKRK